MQCHACPFNLLCGEDVGTGDIAGLLELCNLIFRQVVGGGDFCHYQSGVLADYSYNGRIAFPQ